MNTYHEQLIEFLKVKQSILSMLSKKPPPYVDERDFEDIRSWTQKDSRYVVEKIMRELDTYRITRGCLYMNNLFDGEFCPWCWHSSSPWNTTKDCKACTYGMRHGVCGQADTSDWAALVDRFAQVEINRELTAKEVDELCAAISGFTTQHGGIQ